MWALSELVAIQLFIFEYTLTHCGESDQSKTFSHGPDEKSKGTLALSPCPSGKTGLRQDPASRKSQVFSFGDTTLPSGLWLSIVKQLFL